MKAYKIKVTGNLLGREDEYGNREVTGERTREHTIQIKRICGGARYWIEGEEVSGDKFAFFLACELNLDLPVMEIRQ